MAKMQQKGIVLELLKKSGEWTLIPEGETRIENNQIAVLLPEGTWYPVEYNYEEETAGKAPVRWSTEREDGFEYFEENQNSMMMFTFACQNGRDRTSDLSKSVSAYLRGKLLENDGSFDLIDALHDMPDNVGHTLGSENIPEMVQTAADWTDEKKQVLAAVHLQEKKAMENGFYPLST